MNEFLRKFDTIRFVAPWSIFRIFLRIFHFFEFKFEFWIWAGLIPAQTETGPDRFGEPWLELERREGEAVPRLATSARPRLGDLLREPSWCAPATRAERCHLPQQGHAPSPAWPLPIAVARGTSSAHLLAPPPSGRAEPRIVPFGMMLSEEAPLVIMVKS